MDKETSVKVAVRIRPLLNDELIHDNSLLINVDPSSSKILAGSEHGFTFDYTFGAEASQSYIFENCVIDLVNAAFEGFNATILAYGQTGSGKTWTMGSSSSMMQNSDTMGIIPRVIKNLFEIIEKKEEADPNSAYKVHVQFLELYGEEIKDLLDQTKTSKVNIRETRDGGVFISGAREELVNSYEQMMKALEDGSKHRTTAATKMNQTSSRSHAIFTVILEHTIHNAIDESANENNSNLDETNGETVQNNQKSLSVSHSTYEVRRSKFHFVDLAGSERAKRTGAQGVQLKEGIDINKGLLALGNVISALGDEQKRGKVFVPYRDSKLTRILQDSLGGNSKTLMICCVSPALLNFNESLNALRYANRARNIKNKPKINRDPTLIIIDELKFLVQSLSSELLEIRTEKKYLESENITPIDLLQHWANMPSRKANVSFSSTNSSGLANSFQAKRPYSTSQLQLTTSSMQKNSTNNESKKLIQSLNLEISNLKIKLADSDFEVRRLSDQNKQSKLHVSELTDQLYLAKGEKDFFKMKWTEACPEEAKLLEQQSEYNPSPDSNQEPEKDNLVDGLEVHISKKDTPSLAKQKENVVGIISEHLKEIDKLKAELARERTMEKKYLPSNLNPGNDIDQLYDSDFTTNISTLISQTREQLRMESKKLKDLEVRNKLASEDDDGEEDDGLISEDDKYDQDHSSNHLEIEEEKAFIKRQKILSNEVDEISQSIQLKEQLLSQLTRSQQQYSTMKAYYEQKLELLEHEVDNKQKERDIVFRELEEISGQKTEVLAETQERENRLKEQLKRKDEELKNLKKKQQELNQLSQVQSRYSSQLTKLQNDITSMKKQRVNLAKTLQQEKKNHMQVLSQKAREIEKLKKELVRRNNEVKKLGRDKEIAQNRAKDAIKEGFELKKKAQELIKSGEFSTQTARAAIRAVHKATRFNTSKRILSEEELRTKKWLDKRIEEISVREAAADSLKKQYEYQLELLKRKEALEIEKNLALLQAEVAQHSHSKPTSSKDCKEVDKINENESNLNSNLLLSSNEEEKLLEIEEQLLSIKDQIDLKEQQINDIQHQISVVGDIPSSDKTIEVLKRTAAGSLPASHELIRLLFDMLVHSSKTIQIKVDSIKDLLEKEKQYKSTIEEYETRLASVLRTHDQELTKVTNEYEEKMYNLLNNFKVESESSQDAGKSIQMNLYLEESNLLKTQLEREVVRNKELEEKIDNFFNLNKKLHKDIEEKNYQIKFLEEDRQLFKEMAENYKIGLESLGRSGKNIINSVKNKSIESKKSGSLFLEYISMNNENEDDDEETESLIGEYDYLLEEINKTGFIGSLPTTLHSSQSSTDYHASSGRNNNSSQKSIYERLTNPSNFTGHMKNVFENDIETKRKKIQQIRNQEKNNASSLSKREIHLSSNLPPASNTNSSFNNIPTPTVNSNNIVSSTNIPSPSLGTPALPSNGSTKEANSFTKKNSFEVRKNYNDFFEQFDQNTSSKQRKEDNQAIETTESNDSSKYSSQSKDISPSSSSKLTKKDPPIDFSDKSSLNISVDDVEISFHRSNDCQSKENTTEYQQNISNNNNSSVSTTTTQSSLATNIQSNTPNHAQQDSLPNVFSRLTTKLTGIHKYRKLDDNVSQRSNSPSNPSL